MIPKYIKADEVRSGDTIVWNTVDEDFPLTYMIVKDIEEGETDRGNTCIHFIGKIYGGNGGGGKYFYPLNPDKKYKILLLDRKEKDQLEFEFKV